MASQLDDPPPSPALPAEGREQEGNSGSDCVPVSIPRAAMNEVIALFNRVGNAPRVERCGTLFDHSTRGALPTRLNDSVQTA